MKRVLVVEDDWRVREIMTRILKRAGYDVTAVRGVREAIATIGPWDCIVTDWRLQDGHGREVLAYWHEVTAISVSCTEEADLPKSFSFDELTAAVAAKVQGVT